jgi:hypothetical protein
MADQMTTRRRATATTRPPPAAATITAAPTLPNRSRNASGQFNSQTAENDPPANQILSPLPGITVQPPSDQHTTRSNTVEPDLPPLSEIPNPKDLKEISPIKLKDMNFHK